MKNCLFMYGFGVDKVRKYASLCSIFRPHNRQNVLTVNYAVILPYTPILSIITVTN